MKLHTDPEDSFAFYSSSNPFCLLSFSAIQAQENNLHLAKFGILTNSGSTPVATWTQSCFHTLLASRYGQLLLHTIS